MTGATEIPASMSEMEKNRVPINGAQALVAALAAGGVELCFANPGTSEMQMVAALGEQRRLRPVLVLFEGVASGAADGYARIAGKPAATLLHLGPGLANALANLHNARRARSPIVNIVGDHASGHGALDPPLASDIAGCAGLVSAWVRTSRGASALAEDGKAAIAAARSCRGIASLIVPADHTWNPAPPTTPPPAPAPSVARVDAQAVARAVDLLRTARSAALLLGGAALDATALAQAARTELPLFCETFPARLQRGQGRVAPVRTPYFAEQAQAALAQVDVLITVDAREPVAFFAYPGRPGRLSPPHCVHHPLAGDGDDVLGALAALADALGGARAPLRSSPRPTAPAQDSPLAALTPTLLGDCVAALLPADAIVSDEAGSSGGALFAALANAPPHDWLTLTGGAIGQGLPVAIGAALAAPGRKVISLQADGSGLFTPQALWTMAREGLDITVVIMNNARYAILETELARVGVAAPGADTLSMLRLQQPAIRWVELAHGLGVPASRATTLGEFHQQFAQAMAAGGPRLIEALLP